VGNGDVHQSPLAKSFYARGDGMVSCAGREPLPLGTRVYNYWVAGVFDQLAGTAH